jgi:hypothetical protein
VVLYTHEVNIVKPIVVRRFRKDVAEIENFRKLLGEKIHLRSSYNTKSKLADNRHPSTSKVATFKKKLVKNTNTGSRTATLVYIGNGKHKYKLLAKGINVNINLPNIHHEQ